MEKFGIFELLDTLSALTQSQTDEAQPQNGESGESSAPVKVSPNDAAFAPPAFGIPQPLSGGEAASDGNAFSALLARHEKISKKIDGQK